MSHVTTIDLEIKDLEALKAACNRLGFAYLSDVKQYRAYYGYQKCDHCIRIPEARFEVGIQTQGGKSTLLWDNYYTGRLEEKLGIGAGLLKQAYAAEVTTRAARRAGYSVYERQDEGRIALTIQRRE
jgi:hypothetical protein